MWLHKSNNTTPDNVDEMVRYLVFLATGKSLLIKDKQTIQVIKESEIVIDELVINFGIEKLSSVFLRYKPIFLAFKKANPILINPNIEIQY